jgi:hypothetical protein
VVVVQHQGQALPARGVCRTLQTGAGTDVIILKIFSPKSLAKNFVFFARTTVSFCKNCDHNIDLLRKTPIFLPKIGKNRRKL